MSLHFSTCGSPEVLSVILHPFKGLGSHKCHFEERYNVVLGKGEIHSLRHTLLLFFLVERMYERDLWHYQNLVLRVTKDYTVVTKSDRGRGLI